MITRISVVLLVVAALAGCSGTVPESDWCSLFDFATSDYGATINRGSWTANGITNDEDGRLDIVYVHSQNVQPTAIRVWLGRGENTYSPIDVTVYANVFGLRIGPLSSTFPESEWDYQATVLTPENNVLMGTVIEIKGKATERIYLQSLEVRGNGPNPFGSSNCSTSATGQPPIPLPNRELLDALQDADAEMAGVDGSLLAPDGHPILPAQTGALIFGYAKWLMSPSTTDELFGPFAGVISHLSIYIVAIIALVLIYSIIFAATYFIRWVIWFFKLIMQIVVAIASVVDTVIGKAIGAVLKFIGA